MLAEHQSIFTNIDKYHLELSTNMNITETFNIQLFVISLFVQQILNTIAKKDFKARLAQLNSKKCEMEAAYRMFCQDVLSDFTNKK